MNPVFRFTLVVAGTLLSSACALPPPSATAPATGAAAPKALTSDRLTPPVYAVGDTWKYSDGYGMRVEQVTGDIARFVRTDDSSQYYTAHALFREESKSETVLRKTVYRSEDPMLLFTAPPGSTLAYAEEYLRDGATLKHQVTWEIGTRQKITVPAGTFDTILLTMRARSLTGNWVGFERWWYSPKVKNYVRLEFKYGDTPESSRVLESYDVK